MLLLLIYLLKTKKSRAGEALAKFELNRFFARASGGYSLPKLHETVPQKELSLLPSVTLCFKNFSEYSLFDPLN